MDVLNGRHGKMYLVDVLTSLDEVVKVPDLIQWVFINGETIFIVIKTLLKLSFCPVLTFLLSEIFDETVTFQQVKYFV